MGWTLKAANVTVPLASARVRLRLSLSLPIGFSLYGTVSCATTTFTTTYPNTAILASWRLAVIPLVVTGIQFDCHTSLDFCSFCLCIAKDLVRIEYVACSRLELHGGIALKAGLVVTRERMREYIPSQAERDPSYSNTLTSLKLCSRMSHRPDAYSADPHVLHTTHFQW
jgi:hypothetical protein